MSETESTLAVPALNNVNVRQIDNYAKCNYGNAKNLYLTCQKSASEEMLDMF